MLHAQPTFTPTSSLLLLPPKTSHSTGRGKALASPQPGMPLFKHIPHVCVATGVEACSASRRASFFSFICTAEKCASLVLAGMSAAGFLR